MKRYVIIQCLSLFILCFLLNTAHASFKKNLWTIWAPTNPLSQAVISHKEWQDLLNHYVVTNEEGINLVDYHNLIKKDLRLLSEYIDRLSHIKITEYNRQEQLAYWINLYNALTVRTIANYYPIASIQDINISPGLFSIGPWGANLITINNISMTLDDIHNRIIRPIWNDSRTHYAINNGTIGAPNLSMQAYTGATINQQLNNAAMQYINSNRGVEVIEGKLIVSKLYSWFEEDFGGNDNGIIKHISPFANPVLKAQLSHINHIDNYIYNWHLNHTNAGDREEPIRH